MRRTIATGLAVVLLGGCGGNDGDAVRQPATATATATGTPAPPATPEARTVSFKATDGEPVSAEYTAAGKHAPAVVLLHEIHGRPGQWEDFVPYLHAAGFATLAYESRGSPVERDRLPDALGALRWLRARPDVDSKRLALVGASVGASTTVLAMTSGASRTVDAAVALSPPDTPDIADLQDAGRYRPHDVLLVSDESESEPVDGMLRGARRSKAIRSEGPGHGVDLLAEPGVRTALLSWLDDRVRR